mmetsp:Transcript_9963/g.10066  ORF Transcript_9963/g.10066 Transcript_9963/m.10066 type:complete len:94 (-) Transcript_9963:66-347(-)
MYCNTQNDHSTADCQRVNDNNDTDNQSFNCMVTVYTNHNNQKFINVSVNDIDIKSTNYKHSLEIICDSGASMSLFNIKLCLQILNRHLSIQYV